MKIEMLSIIAHLGYKYMCGIMFHRIDLHLKILVLFNYFVNQTNNYK